MAFCGMLFKQLLFGVLISAAVVALETNSSYNKTCGSLSIPYPFGTSDDSYLDPSFLITCNHSFDTPKPFLRTSNIEIFGISLDGELEVRNFFSSNCDYGYYSNWSLSLQRFHVSNPRNKFTAVGCNTVAYIEGRTEQKNFTTGCVSRCDSIDSVVNGSCDGVGCCQSSIPENITFLNIFVGTLNNHFDVQSSTPCSFGFLAKEEAYKFSSLDLANLPDLKEVPVVLDWAVGNEAYPETQKNQTGYSCKAKDSECYNSTNGPGYRCRCSFGYEGNPYIPGGCKDIDECKISKCCGIGQQCITSCQISNVFV